MRTRIALTVLAVAAASLGAVGNGGEHRAAERTDRFLDALERKDFAVAGELMDPRIRYVMRMNQTGAQTPAWDVTGREQVTARLGAIGELVSTVRFADRRISTTDRGRTTFVQSNGDFVTADGRPYRNVYVFRFDWRDGRVVTFEEYANPVTICVTYGCPAT